MIVTEAQIAGMSLLTEAAWQNKWFIPLFRFHGWRGFHAPDSRQTQGQFLDWILWRDRILHVELKAEKGHPTKLQIQMMLELEAANGLVYLWYPRMWREIERILT